MQRKRNGEKCFWVEWVSRKCIWMYICTRSLLQVGLMNLPVLMLLKSILQHVFQLLPLPEGGGSLRNLLSPPVSASYAFGRWIQFFTVLIIACRGRAVMKEEGRNEREMKIETSSQTDFQRQTLCSPLRATCLLWFWCGWWSLGSPSLKNKGNIPNVVVVAVLCRVWFCR